MAQQHRQIYSENKSYLGDHSFEGLHHWTVSSEIYHPSKDRLECEMNANFPQMVPTPENIPLNCLCSRHQQIFDQLCRANF